MRVRRKVVDATYLETPVPSTHTPSFDVDPDVRLIPVNDLVALTEPGRGYTIIGAGKTAMDACSWLLDNGVAPDAIRWIRPRDAWILDRAFQQPLELVAALIEGVSLYLEAAAEAESVDDLFRRLEACGQLRPDRPDSRADDVPVRDREPGRAGEPASHRERGAAGPGGARRGRPDRAGGRVDPDRPRAGPRRLLGRRSARRPARPIFEPDRITLQQVRTCQPTFNAALVAFVESARDDDAEKNRLCPPNPYPDAAIDWIAGDRHRPARPGRVVRRARPLAWMERSRLDAARGIGDHMTDPGMRSALARLVANTEPAIANLARLEKVGPRTE